MGASIWDPDGSVPAGVAALLARLQDAVDPANGDFLLAVRKLVTGALATTQHEVNERSLHFMDFLSDAEKADYIAGAHTLDLSAKLTQADAALASKGGGTLYLGWGSARLNAAVIRSRKVTWKGESFGSTFLTAYHNGIAVQGGVGGTVGPVNPENDCGAGIHDVTVRGGGGFTPSIAIFNWGLTFSTLKNISTSDCAIGVRDRFLLNSTYWNFVSSCTVAHEILDTSAADPCNENTYIEAKYTGSNTIGLDYDALYSFGNVWIGAGFEGAVDPMIATNGSGALFILPYLESNTRSFQLLAGVTGFKFLNVQNISAQEFIHGATFAAKQIVVDGLVDNTNSGCYLNREINCSGVVLIPNAGFAGQEVIQVKEGWGDAISCYSYNANHNAAKVASGISFVSPLGGPIPPIRNYLTNQDMSNAGAWTGVQAAAGAINPFGGANAFTLNAADSSHTCSIVGAATGRTFTAQLFGFCSGNGSLKLIIGTGTANYRTVTFKLHKPGWFLASVTHQFGVDASTNFILTVAAPSGVVLGWRPCIYEYGSPLPAIPASRDLTGIATPMEMKNLVLFNYATAIPTVGAFAVGDHTFNVVGTVGQPKGWTCTVAGSPGTQTSWGNL